MQEVTVTKIDDPDFLDSAAVLKKQMEAELDKEPERAHEIIDEYRGKMKNLVDWWETNRVRWTITDVPEDRLREEGLIAQ